MNILLLIAGIGALVVFALHTFVGRSKMVIPFLANDIDQEQKLVMLANYFVVAVVLLGSGVVFCSARLVNFANFLAGGPEGWRLSKLLFVQRMRRSSRLGSGCSFLCPWRCWPLAWCFA